MKGLKTSYFVTFLMLIVVSISMNQLFADEVNDEGKQAVFQEFIKMADEFEKQNKINEAIDIYERILKTDSENVELNTKLAALYTRTSQHEQAAEIWNKLLDTDPENPNYHDSLCNSLQAAGKLDEAIEIVQSYIQMSPDDGIHYARLAKLYADSENDEKVIANFEKAIELGHNDRETNIKLAELYFINDNIDGAKNALKNAIQFTTSEWQRQGLEKQLMNIYRYEGNLDQMLQQAQDDGTITTEMQKERLKQLLNDDELEKVIESYQKAIDMTESSYEKNKLIVELLKTYIKQDRTDSALKFYSAEMKKIPRNTTVVTSYGPFGITVTLGGDDTRKALINAYKAQKNLDDLIKHFEDKLKSTANDPSAIEIIADSYFQTGKFKKSAEYYKKLHKVEPKNVRSLYLAAAAYQKSNQPEMVKKTLTEADTALATSRNHRSTSFKGAIATICLNNEMHDSAIKHAKDAVTEVEDEAEAMDDNWGDDDWGLKYYYFILAKCLQGGEQHDEAYKTYQKVLKVDADGYMNQQAEEEMKKIAKSARLYDKWIPEQLKKVQENPNNTEYIIELAQSYEATSKIEEAIPQYERLVDLEPNNVGWYRKLGAYYQNVLPEKREIGKTIKGTTLTLPGNGSYVEMDDSETLDSISDQVTVSAWIKPTSFPNNYVRIVFRSDELRQNYRQRSYVLAIRSDGKLKIASSPKDGGFSSLYSPPGLIKLNTWTHIAGVIDVKNDHMKVFVNGHEYAHRNFDGKERFIKTKLPLRIGVTHIKDQVQNTSFVGQIDEVRIWNIPRTEAEIRADMNRELNGDEPGLVAYWKFDEAKNGRIFDASPNKNDGKLIGNATIDTYSRQVFNTNKSEQLKKSINAYQIALGLDPSQYQTYDLLAKTYVKAELISDAKEIYLQALAAPLRQVDYNAAIRAISKLYTDGQQNENLIALFEDIRPKMQNSATLHEILGDLYKKVSKQDEAQIAYAKWLQIRQRELNRQRNAYQDRRFANQLLDMRLFPKEALKLAKRAFHHNAGSGYEYHATVGHACVANGLYDEALKYYKHAFRSVTNDNALNNILGEIEDEFSKANDNDRYFQFIETLSNSVLPEFSFSKANVYQIKFKLRLAKWYSENNMHNKANQIMQHYGMIAENAWLTLGPFDNTAGIGYHTKYIAEEKTQLDLNAKHEGLGDQIRWETLEDTIYDGFIDLGENQNWSVAYVWTTISSPEEKTVQFRFDSDDQAKIWLNGIEVYANDESKSVSIDRDIVPVTLNAGKNTVLVKVCNEEQQWGFYLRVTDGEGKPVEGLTFYDPNINKP